jgi:hypothetical protein
MFFMYDRLFQLRWQYICALAFCGWTAAAALSAREILVNVLAAYYLILFMVA